MELGEEGLDARRAGNALVQFERDVGREPQPQRPPDARAQMTRHTRQTVERGCTLRLAAENADEHLCVSKIAGDIDAGDSNESDDARVFDPFREKSRHFFANRFRDSVGATVSVRHDSVDPSPYRTFD